MGCQQAKVRHDPGLGNGRKFSENKNGEPAVSCNLTLEPESVVKADPRSPLDSRQMFRIKQSWKGIRRHMEDTGLEMFLRMMYQHIGKPSRYTTSIGLFAGGLFKSNTELKGMFHAFKDLTNDDDLRSNEALENHATLVMTTLDDAITHIDNFDYVAEVLRKTGASHVRFEGFKTDNFWNIREPFLEAVKITLGDRYTDNMESIYKVAITFILQTMSEGMEDAMKNKSTDSS